MESDQIKAAALIAHYAGLRAEYLDWLEGGSDDAELLAEFICDQEGYGIDSGSDEDNQACAQIDRIAPACARAIFDDWAAGMRLERIGELAEGLFQAEAQRAAAMLAAGFSEADCAARILRDRPALENLHEWNGKI